MELSQPWGKFDRGNSLRHHLAHHCADVAACFIALVNIPVIRARMETAAGRTLNEADIERLGVLVFLHDAGKLHPGFQAKGWPDGNWHGQKFGHLQEGYDLFMVMGDGPAATALHIAKLAEWGITPSHLRAVLAHHGRPIVPEIRDKQALLKRVWKRHGAYDPDCAAAEIGAVIRAWFPAAFLTPARALPDSPAFEHLLSGLTALADWIGSSDRFVFVSRLDPNYMKRARRLAAETVTAFGIDASRQRGARRGPATFREISGHAKPNAQQQIVGSVNLDARLVILEAETGAGKTEAALWRYAQLFESGRVDGLYFAVPTRAAATQLHGRVVDAAKRLFGCADPQPILAIPGYIKAGAAEGTPLPHWQVRWDDERDADEGKLAARWAAEHSKRYLAAQIAVGTVDQAMLAALMVKHAHMRAAGLARSLLVIDEVHASDRFMTAVQKRLLDAHLAVGGYAMLMSATLGSTARAQWLGQAQPSFAEAVSAPYPAVWTGQNAGSFTVEAPPTRTKAVAMEALATMAPDATTTSALDAARRGARVLVIRNTVKRAVETLHALEAAALPGDAELLFRVGGAGTLHHSRFSPDDRRMLDRAAEELLTKDRNRPSGGKIIVGTQTLEQSLDIDADILITDLCPVDVLLQRVGRLHRHDLPRPRGFEAPRCIVMIPEGGLEPLLQPGFENGLGARRSPDGTYGGIYRDLAILELTRRLIGNPVEWSIPAMNRQLVEGATHPEAIERLQAELGPAWRTYDANVLAGELAMETVARLYGLDRTKRFEELAFPGAEERIRTRLGGEGARITFDKPPLGPFGQRVTEILLPAHISNKVVVDQPPIVNVEAKGFFRFSVGGARFVYDRLGVRRE
jgi:CRISPR-associated endonuclease/helicase Cas3